VLLFARRPSERCSPRHGGSLRLGRDRAGLREQAFELAPARAAELWRSTLESCEPPPIDDAIEAELKEFVVRRRAELGD
jgi:hypothetical protein